jgi:hypothetical protein
MTTPAYQRERGRLAETLQALRVGAGLSAAPETAGDLLTMLRGARVEYAACKDAYRQSGVGGVETASWNWKRRQCGSRNSSRA